MLGQKKFTRRGPSAIHSTKPLGRIRTVIGEPFDRPVSAEPDERGARIDGSRRQRDEVRVSQNNLGPVVYKISCHQWVELNKPGKVCKALGS